jgi:hypothetical protein
VYVCVFVTGGSVLFSPVFCVDFLSTAAAVATSAAGGFTSPLSFCFLMPAFLNQPLHYPLLQQVYPQALSAGLFTGADTIAAVCTSERFTNTWIIHHSCQYYANGSSLIAPYWRADSFLNIQTLSHVDVHGLHI